MHVSYSKVVLAPLWFSLTIRSSSYPHALHHLDLLQHPQFRSEMKKDEFLREYLHQKQFDHWRTWSVEFVILDGRIFIDFHPTFFFSEQA